MKIRNSAVRTTGALASMALVLACGGGGNVSAASDPAAIRPSAVSGTTASHDASPAVADGEATFVMATSLLGTTMDPHLATAVTEHTQLWPFWDTLLKLSPAFELEPNLATSWTVSADGLTIDLTLRDDVTFQDGSAFTADAVVASLDRAQNLPESKVASQLAAVTGVEAVDSQTARIRLSEPDATILASLALQAGMMINPAMIDDSDAVAAGASGVSTGPYTLDEFIPGDLATFDKFDGYWDEDVVANAPRRYEALFIPDKTARLNGLRDGTFQAVASGGMPAELDAETGSNSEVLFDPIAAAQTVTLFFDTDSPPFDDPAVRRAVAQAIDFDSITATVLEADCFGRADQIWSSANWAHDPDLVALPYDLDVARQSLADAGYPDGLSFDLAVGSGTSTEVAGQAFQAALAEIGITVNLVSVPLPQAVEGFLGGQHHALVTSIAAKGDPGNQITEQLLGWNLVDDSAAGTEFGELAHEARFGTLDRDARAEIYREISELVVDQAWFVPFCPTRFGFGHTPGATGIQDSVQPNFIGLDIRTVRIQD